MFHLCQNGIDGLEAWRGNWAQCCIRIGFQQLGPKLKMDGLSALAGPTVKMKVVFNFEHPPPPNSTMAPKILRGDPMDPTAVGGGARAPSTPLNLPLVSALVAAVTRRGRPRRAPRHR